MSTTNKTLFIISSILESIGGHKISTFTISRYLIKAGFEVGLLFSPPTVPYPELDDLAATIHYAPYKKHLPSIFVRPVQILKAANNGYTSMIAADWIAAYESFLAVIRYKLPLVQIIAGGRVPDRRPIMIPGIVVFSEELFEQIPEHLGVPKEYLLLSPGRVDFDYFSKSTREDKSPVQFIPGAQKVLIVSRLTGLKFNAIKAALDQFCFESDTDIHCIVIGDGKARKNLEERAQEIVRTQGKRIQIDFLGAFRVNPDVLRQADLVIGQGRTVIEAIASGVPAAVSGSAGYFGLITEDNFAEFSKTNMTGRDLSPFSLLKDDLKNLGSLKGDRLLKIYEMVFNVYDASNGVQSIISAVELSKEFIERKNRFQIFMIFCNWLFDLTLISRIKKSGGDRFLRSSLPEEHPS